jgi:hypothetical protein
LHTVALETLRLGCENVLLENVYILKC